MTSTISDCYFILPYKNTQIHNIFLYADKIICFLSKIYKEDLFNITLKKYYIISYMYIMLEN